MDKNKKIDVDKLATQIKYKIASDYPFFAPIAWQTKVEYQPELPSCGTDGDRIILNDMFIEVDKDKKITIILHELLHILWLHIPRYNRINGDGYRMLFNVVADYRINETLRDEGQKIDGDLVKDETIENYLKKDFDSTQDKGLKEVADIVRDEELSWEQAFKIVKRYMKKKPGGGGSGNKTRKALTPNDLKRNKNMTQKDIQKMRKKIQDAINKGIAKEKMRGDTSGNWSNKFEDLIIHKEVPWTKIVKEQVKELLRGRRTWHKFHKKSFIKGVRQVIPGYKRRKKMRVTIGIDVSGSIGDDEYRKFVGEILNLIRKYKAVLKIAIFDTELKNEYEIKTRDDVDELELRTGYGGTSYKEFFKKYGRDRVKVVFTDGYGDQKDIKKHRGTIWVTTESTDFDWGRVVKVKNIKV